jgi:hypothetical protein
LVEEKNYQVQRVESPPFVQEVQIVEPPRRLAVALGAVAEVLPVAALPVVVLPAAAPGAVLPAVPVAVLAEAVPVAALAAAVLAAVLPEAVLLVAVLRAAARLAVAQPEVVQAAVAPELVRREVVPVAARQEVVRGPTIAPGPTVPIEGLPTLLPGEQADSGYPNQERCFHRQFRLSRRFAVAD